MITRRTALLRALRAGAALPFMTAASLLPGAALAAGEDYPSKPMDLIIPFAPGGGLDLFGRTVARVLEDQKLVTVPIQISNLPGAGGSLGMAQMVQRAGDPYAMVTMALHVHLTPLMQGTPYSYKDMTPIAKLYSEFNLIVVRAESPIKSLDEIAAKLKEDPGSVSFGGATVGNSDHITISTFAMSLGIDPTKLTYVAYSGGESNAAILGGHVDVGLGGPDMMDLVDAGKMRVLAVSSPKRLTGRLADVPTFREQGYDVVFDTWRGLFGTKDMPDYAVTFWRDTLAKMVQTDEWKEELAKNQWVDAFDPNFGETLDAEHERLRKVLSDLGLIQ
jgi:putative tricarboxylic transport membrane protein